MHPTAASVSTSTSSSVNREHWLRSSAPSSQVMDRAEKRKSPLTWLVKKLSGIPKSDEAEMGKPAAHAQVKFDLKQTVCNCSNMKLHSLDNVLPNIMLAHSPALLVDRNPLISDHASNYKEHMYVNVISKKKGKDPGKTATTHPPSLPIIIVHLALELCKC